MRFFAIASLALLVLVSCFDPTEQTISVRIQNDTSKPVAVRRCAGGTDQLALRCTSFLESETLKPGDGDSFNTSDEGVPNPFLVQDMAGNRLGCLPLVFHHKSDEGSTVLASTATPCPT